MQPYNLQTLVDRLRQHSKDAVLYLPRTSDMRQLAKATTESEKIEVIHYCMEGASKVGPRCPLLECDYLIESQALCAYFGAFKFSVDSAII